MTVTIHFRIDEQEHILLAQVFEIEAYAPRSYMVTAHPRRAPTGMGGSNPPEGLRDRRVDGRGRGRVRRSLVEVVG